MTMMMDGVTLKEEMKILSIRRYYTFTELLLLIILTLSLSLLINYHWKRRKMYRLASKFDGPNGLPIIGSAYLFIGSNENILTTIMQLFNKYRIPAKIWFGNRLFIGISDPEHYDIIFNHPKAIEKDPLFKFVKPILGDGLFSAPGDKWKKNRKVISPAFNQRILNDFVPILTRHATTLEGILLKNVDKNIDITYYAGKCIVDIVCETSMGIKVDAQLKESEFLQWVEELFSIVFKRMFHIWYHLDFVFYNSPIGRRFNTILNKFIDFTNEVVIEKKALYYENKEIAKEYPEAQTEEILGSKRIKSLLDLLIELTEENDVFDNRQLRDEVCTFLVGGSDTTTNVFGSVMITLGMFQEHQQRVYEEVIDVLGTDKAIEHTDLPRLKYTERFILETLRVFPLGAIVVRYHQEDINLGELTVPSGSTSILCILHTHRSEKYWPEPLKFDPDRFLPEEVAKRHPYAFMPFSGGPRNCIGKKFGLMMIKCIIAQLIRRFKITTPYKRIEDIKLKQDIITKPVDGFNVRLTLRN